MKTLWTITLFFVLLLSGCKSKQRLTESEKITKIDTVTVVQEKIDAIFRDRIIEKTKPVYFETEIPCDSLISGRVGSGDNYTEYKIENGKIILKTKIDSLESVYSNEYRSQWRKDSINLRKELISEKETESVTKVYVYPWWLYVVCGLAILLLAWKIANWFKIITI